MNLLVYPSYQLGMRHRIQLVANKSLIGLEHIDNARNELHIAGEIWFQKTIRQESRGDDYYSLHGLYFKKIVLHSSCKQQWSWQFAELMTPRLLSLCREPPHTFIHLSPERLWL